MSARRRVAEDDEFEDEFAEDDGDPQADHGPLPTRSARRHLTGLCLGYLAMTPLLVAYELARDSGRRNAAEVLLLAVFEPLGDAAPTARVALLVALAVGALVVCHRRRIAPVPQVVRIAAEGLFAALLLGPALVLVLRLLRVAEHVGGASASGGRPPSGAQAALAFGAGAWEEVLFRVLVYGLVFLLARRVLAHWHAPRRVARVSCELLALVLSSLSFAALHLSMFLPRGWQGGEAYDGGVFLWRVVAGALLAGLFRWRGPGVAAWAHGLFNVALLLHVDPKVLL